MGERMRIDELGELIRQKRIRENLTLRSAANQCGLSAATLSRLENRNMQRLPDGETLVAIAKWLGISVDQFLGTDERESGNTAEKIHAHLRADKNLSKEAADALAELIRVAYNQFAKNK